MNNKTILVTGGAGYVGSACVHALVEMGATVIVVDDLSRGDRKYVPDGVDFHRTDVTDRAGMLGVFEQYDFDWVIHCAGLKSLPESNEIPNHYVQSNIGGMLTMLDVMHEQGVRNIVFSSTAAVYAENESGLYTEEEKTMPLSTYGYTKLMCESLIEHYKTQGLLEQAVIFRYFNIAGDAEVGYQSEQEENVFNVLARAIRDKSDFYITGTDFDTPDGTGVRDYVHIRDLVQAHIQAIEQSASGLFNIGTEQGYSVRELVDEFNLQAGNTLQVKEAPRREGDIGVCLAKPTRAHEILGWQAEHTLEDMVRSTLQANNVL